MPVLRESSARDSHILVDAAQVSAEPKGVGLYTLNVLEHWLKADDRLNLTVLVPDNTDTDHLFSSVSGRIIRVPWRNHLWHGWKTIPNAIRESAPEVAWIPYETPLAHLSKPYGMVCHDIPRKIREAQTAGGGEEEGFATRLARRLDERLINRSLRSASVVFANSEYVARHLISDSGVAPSLVREAPCAPGADFYELSAQVSIPEVLSNLGLAKGYILVLFTGDERENIRIIPRVFDHLVARGIQQGIVVAGVKAEVRTEVEQMFADFSWRDRVRVLPFLGPREKQRLADIYTAADIYLDTSLHEGFGMQIIEAMACSTPVVCSDRGALPEVAGSSAVLVDPTDSSAIADQIELLLADPFRLQQMAERGQRRSRDFTWSQTALTILEALRDVAMNRRE